MTSLLLGFTIAGYHFAASGASRAKKPAPAEVEPNIPKRRRRTGERRRRQCSGPLVRLAKNHPLLDGNKRAARVALRVFVEINSWTWKAKPNIHDAEAAVLAVAAGEWDEYGTAAWRAPPPRAATSADPDTMDSKPANSGVIAQAHPPTSPRRCW